MRDFKLTKQELIEFKGMELNHALAVLDNANVSYNALGDTFIKMYLNAQLERDPDYFYEVAPGIVKARTEENPYRLIIEINELPPRLAAYRKSFLSEKMGYGIEQARWHVLIRESLNQVEFKPFKEKVVLYYCFRSKGLTDADNFVVKFVTDAIRDSRIIRDDSCDYVAPVTEIADGTAGHNMPSFTVTIFPYKYLAEKLSDILHTA